MDYEYLYTDSWRLVKVERLMPPLRSASGPRTRNAVSASAALQDENYRNHTQRQVLLFLCTPANNNTNLYGCKYVCLRV